MRNFTLLFVGLFFSVLTYAQSPSPGSRCATYESMKEFRKLHPDAETDAQFEAWLQNKTNDRLLSNERVTVSYTIPIIFHIVNNGEAVGTGRNLSAAKIASQLAQINADYANLSGSTYGVAANVDIQFCLAIQGPDGTMLAEPGIDRIDRNTHSPVWNAPPYAGTASNSYVDATIMPQSIWDPYRYFNVWVLDISGTLIGKATFPTSSTLPGLGSGETDTHAGVFIDYQSVGSVSDPGPGGTSFGLGRTLSHEAGHFFGLRHIWGDALCGDDFCADTPPQDDQSTGCPTQPAPNNCTPAGNKMFENYMDYTNDACVNTLTADQKTRMQTVMANSSRRASLGTSDACTAAPGNSIRFVTTATSTTETGTGACPRVKNVTLTLRISSPAGATGNATVTFTKGGTATDNIDYTITPASVSYTMGDNADKTVTVHINDDAAVESAETIIIGFTISGGSGVVNASSGLNHTITIIDDDMAHAINTSGTVTLLNENFGTTGGTLPAGWIAGDFLGPGGSANQWVISTGGGAGTTDQSAYISEDVAGAPPPATYDENQESFVVLRTKQIKAQGYTNLRLGFKYKCVGEVFLGDIFDFGTLGYSANGSSFGFLLDGTNSQYHFVNQPNITTINNLDIQNSLQNSSFYLGFIWNNDESEGEDPGFVIDDITVTGDARRVESTASSTASENIFAGQDVYMFSADGDLVARIKNPSVDIGCLSATVTTAGNGTTSIATTSGSFFRTNKVIQITPGNANAAVTYEGTLYFTTAELATWGSAIPNLKILKVKDGTNLATTLDASNAELITPSFGDSSASGYYTYTGNFTGFSQFMLVSASTTLPIELISFEARAVTKTVVLNWSTSLELNNKGFSIERSADGSNFEKIGWVDGKITTNSRTDYVYKDNYVQPGVVYYYRLRQTDIDDHQKLSVVRQAKVDQKGISLTVSPNPARDQLNLFIPGSSSLASVSLVNMQGQLMRKWDRVNASATSVPLNIVGLPGGIYMLHVQLQGEKIIQKVVVK